VQRVQPALPPAAPRALSVQRQLSGVGMPFAGATLVAAAAAAGSLGLPPTYPTVPMSGIAGPMEMPMIGLGTWQYNSSVALEAVSTSFAVGYRHVDTALGYGNQEGVGAALARQNLARDEYFVTSKIPGGLNASATTAALEQSLEQLRLDYVDLMLLHWPGSGATSRQEQWLALEAWAKQGKARAIGISHYCRHHLDSILSVATLPVALNQVQ
jgi:2,5-diketo-D-gluconate reductase A